MADLLDISISALQAFQQAINVTSNNVANANTPGYNRQSVDLATRVPQYFGGGWVGSGVNVVGVTRAFDQASVNQLNTSQSALGQLNAFKSYADGLDNLFGTSGAGITSAVQGFFGAASDVANAPTSAAARTALLGKAQSLVSSIRNAGQQIDGMDTDINTRLAADLAQVNSYAQAIAGLNVQIVHAAAASQGQQPNDLLDQRDALVTKLSGLIGVTTTRDTNGALNVFVGNGQSLVVQGQANALITLPGEFNASQIDVGYGPTGNSISAGINSGEIGGLLAARTQLTGPVRSKLGQLTVAIAQSVNQQQGMGVDLYGNQGTDLFAFTGPQAVAASHNTGGASIAVSLSDPGALGGDDYQLAWQGGSYVLTRMSDGSTVATTGAGTAASPLLAGGLSIVISGAPANGDRFLIQPASAAAGSISVVQGDGSKIAAASAVIGSAGNTNTGSGRIGPASVVDPANANLFTPASIAFTSATTYSINGSGSFAYTPGADITANGWKVQISGTPAAGDTFAVSRNISGKGDNTNALALAALQNQNVLGSGAVSISGALGSLVTQVGAIAQQTTTAQSAQTAVNNSALQAVQSRSGVNLDEEAAALLQWQQAYQAAAQALKIGSSLFDTLIAAVRAG